MRASAFDPLSISPAFWERLDVRQARHPKTLSNRSAQTAPQKASSGPILARGGQARNARGEPSKLDTAPIGWTGRLDAHSCH